MAKLDLVGITVRNMADSLAFYRMLGLDIPIEADVETHVELPLLGGFRIAWDTQELMESIFGEWTTAHGHRIGLAFLCESPKEVDDLYKQVIDAGYQGFKPPWDAFWGQRYAVVFDPDGNLVDLFANL